MATQNDETSYTSQKWVLMNDVDTRLWSNMTDTDWLYTYWFQKKPFKLRMPLLYQPAKLRNWIREFFYVWQGTPSSENDCHKSDKHSFWLKAREHFPCVVSAHPYWQVLCRTAEKMKDISLNSPQSYKTCKVKHNPTHKTPFGVDCTRLSHDQWRVGSSK